MLNFEKKFCFYIGKNWRCRINNKTSLMVLKYEIYKYTNYQKFCFVKKFWQLKISTTKIVRSKNWENWESSSKCFKSFFSNDQKFKKKILFLPFFFNIALYHSIFIKPKINKPLQAPLLWEHPISPASNWAHLLFRLASNQCLAMRATVAPTFPTVYAYV